MAEGGGDREDQGVPGLRDQHALLGSSGQLGHPTGCHQGHVGAAGHHQRPHDDGVHLILDGLDALRLPRTASQLASLLIACHSTNVVAQCAGGAAI